MCERWSVGVLKGQEGKLEEESLTDRPMTWLMVVLQDQIDTILLSASADSRGVSRFCSEVAPRFNESILIIHHTSRVKSGGERTPVSRIVSAIETAHGLGFPHSRKEGTCFCWTWHRHHGYVREECGMESERVLA